MVLCVQNHLPQLNKITAFIKKNISLADNSIWAPEAYANLIAEAAKHLTYIETVNNPDMPNADSLHYHIENKTQEDILHTNFLEMARKQLNRLKGKEITLILDVTHEPFYGSINSNPELIHEYKPEKGCSGSFKFLVALVEADNQRYFLDAVPLPLIYSLKGEAGEMLGRIRGFGMKIKVVLLDREFGRSSEIIDLLNRSGLKYLSMYPDYVNVKEIVKTVESYARMPFEVRGVKTSLVVIRDKDYDWKLVTNLRFRDFANYVKTYKKRWNIETGFRVTDEARIKTKSVDIRVRYFLFLAALILYNIWYLLSKPMSFKRFVMKFWDIVEDIIAIRVT